MNKWRRLLLVAAAGLAVVLALGVAGSALAAGRFGQAYVNQTQVEPGNGEGWVCPLAGDEGTAQAMTEAMQNGDFERMQELMGGGFGQGFGGIMSGWNADAMRQHMESVDVEQMQELMSNGDWDGMRDYMQEQGIEPGGPGGQGFGPGMMNGSQGSMMGGAWGGMMGRR